MLVPSRRCIISITLFIAVETVIGDVVTYEGTSFPEEADKSWEYTPSCDPERWIEDGWLFQNVGVGCGGPPEGDKDRYIRSLADFVGEEQFFIEWRMQTDGESSEITGVAPASMVAGGFFTVAYHFTISRDLVRFQRDAFVVTVFVDIDPEVPHTYRLEQYGAAEYIVYVDGEVIDAGIPGHAYPNDQNDVMAWRAKSWFLENNIKWDYVRLGTIPQDGSGDFNSDGEVNDDDFYFFQECITDPDAGSWRGCSWADFDFDGDVDCDDWQQFQLAWTDPGNPPCLSLCECCADLNADGAVDVSDLLDLLAVWGTCQDCQADLDSDGSVGVVDLLQLIGAWGSCS